MTPLQAFAKNVGLTHGQAAHLIQLVEKAADTQVKEHNDGTPSDTSPVDKYLARFGLKANWSGGIYPIIVRQDGETFHLPD